MKPKESVVRREGARTKRLERVIKGFSNHRRIEILELLAAHSDLCVGEISEKLQIELKTASEQANRSRKASISLALPNVRSLTSRPL